MPAPHHHEIMYLPLTGAARRRAARQILASLAERFFTQEERSELTAALGPAAGRVGALAARIDMYTLGHDARGIDREWYTERRRRQLLDAARAFHKALEAGLLEATASGLLEMAASRPRRDVVGDRKRARMVAAALRHFERGHPPRPADARSSLLRWGAIVNRVARDAMMIGDLCQLFAPEPAPRHRGRPRGPDPDRQDLLRLIVDTWIDDTGRPTKVQQSKGEPHGDFFVFAKIMFNATRRQLGYHPQKSDGALAKAIMRYLKSRRTSAQDRKWAAGR